MFLKELEQDTQLKWGDIDKGKLLKSVKYKWWNVFAKPPIRRPDLEAQRKWLNIWGDTPTKSPSPSTVFWILLKAISNSNIETMPMATSKK